jgi:DNA-binding GntR family transcriptional regulator
VLDCNSHPERGARATVGAARPHTQPYLEMPDTSERSPRIPGVPLIEPDHTLAARGASALREMILTGVLEMGSRLNEVYLSEAFGISRLPLRGAIRSLASQGLLEIVNHKGAFVPSCTAKDLCEIYEVRMALERHSTNTAISSRSSRSATAMPRPS